VQIHWNCATFPWLIPGKMAVFEKTDSLQEVCSQFEGACSQFEEVFTSCPWWCSRGPARLRLLLPVYTNTHLLPVYTNTHTHCIHKHTLNTNTNTHLTQTHTCYLPPYTRVCGCVCLYAYVCTNTHTHTRARTRVYADLIYTYTLAPAIPCHH